MAKNKFKDEHIVAWLFAFLVLCAIMGFVLSGCSLLSTKEIYQPSASETYKNDLRVSINGRIFVGVGVLPSEPSYTVEVFPEGRIDRITWRTCNREEVVDQDPKGFWDGIFGSKKDRYSFTLARTTGLEDVTACGLKITVLEEKKRRNGFAFFDFEDARPEITLPATLTCNGIKSQTSGVSLCQSAAGLYQQIEFPAEVIQKGSGPNCDVMKPLNGDLTKYRFVMPPGEDCVYYFVSNVKDENGKRLTHRLTLIGYTDVPPIKM